MERLDEVRARIAGVEGLRDVVGALRSLAAVRMQQAAERLPGLRRYEETIAGAIGWALALSTVEREPSPRAPGRRAVFVFCAEHGFVGPFNDRLVEAAAAELARAGGRLIVVGARGALRASQRGLVIDRALPMATHPDGVFETARRVARELARRIEAQTVDEAVAVAARHAPGAPLLVESHPLLPPELERFRAAEERAPPLSNLPAPALLDALAGEHVVARLARAAMESLAAESATRLQAMEAAHQNTERRLGDLVALERRLRQDEASGELSDLVNGLDALDER